ncbi:MlaC/ttg2D family ABC transporter substrate-binding protein [Paraburkholderia aromaticivorans]|uniref:MlaC/ttg2D family ABC transporter substrate-binding protein n=1 Tax=Paraburkholderia aromaticivorans TaxID=2026199 RepID=UPI001455F084|nr:ABC transporter substrate-binding protein [Paraburkholderia aromaticivorans]
MKQFLRSTTIRSVLTIILAVCGGVWSFCASADTKYVQIDDQSRPQTLIESATQEILDEVRTQAIRPGDTARIMAVVNRDILPYTDINRTTKLVMGRYWRTATPVQQEQVVTQFTLLLIHTYSGALALLRPDQRFQFPPSRIDPSDTDVVVRTIAMDTGGPVEIDYRLYRTPQGWRVYDLNLMGVWLVQIYRHQFDEEVQKNGIDGLIKLLSKRNEQLASGKL